MNKAASAYRVIKVNKEVSVYRVIEVNKAASVYRVFKVKKGISFDRVKMCLVWTPSIRRTPSQFSGPEFFFGPTLYRDLHLLLWPTLHVLLTWMVYICNVLYHSKCVRSDVYG